MNASLLITTQFFAACSVVCFCIIYTWATGSRFARPVKIAALVVTIIFLSTLAWGKLYSYRRASVSVEDISKAPALAISRLTDALRVDPGSRDLYLKRGLAYKSIKDQENAYHDFQKAAELSFKSRILAVELAKAATATNHFEEAQGLIAEILKEDPKNFDALNARGIIELRENKFAPGLEAFESALSVANTDEERFIAHVNAYLPLFAMKRYDEALSHLKAAMKLRPESADAIAAAANMYGQKAFHGDGTTLHQVALDLAAKALKIDPQQPIAMLTRSAALFYLGERDQAIEQMTRLAELYPNDQEFVFLKKAMEDLASGQQQIPPALFASVGSALRSQKELQR